MLEENRRLVATYAHVASVVFPIVGPALILLVSWKNGYVRRHASVALMFATVAMIVTVTGSALLGESLAVLIVPFFGLVTVAMFNIRRARRGDLPFCDLGSVRTR